MSTKNLPRYKTIGLVPGIVAAIQNDSILVGDIGGTPDRIRATVRLCGDLRTRPLAVGIGVSHGRTLPVVSPHCDRDNSSNNQIKGNRMINSKIPWCDHTWNPWSGCTPKSAGCKHCYALAMLHRFKAPPGPRVSKTQWSIPFSKKVKPDDKVFVCSMSDFFHPDISAQHRIRALGMIKDRPDVTFMILTKRAGLMSYWFENHGDPPPNLWCGVTVESFDYKHRIISLLSVNAKVRFVSAEPLLSALSLSSYLGENKINWLIVGGENGRPARAMDPRWVELLYSEATGAGIPFFFKGWGTVEIKNKTKFPQCSPGGVL